MILSMNLVGADVRRLMIKSDVRPVTKFEPPYVGSYGSWSQLASSSGMVGKIRVTIPRRRDVPPPWRALLRQRP
jgi:hypothetical protein